MNIQGKVAVVTGSSRGIGRATVEALAGAGCSVVVNYTHSQGEAEEVAGQIRSRGGAAICVQASVVDDQDCRRLMAAAVEEFGRLDVLVNNAATTEFIPHRELDRVQEDLWDRVFRVNVRGAFQCARAALPHIEQAGEGEIVNVSSIAGITGEGSSIPYAASKAALITLTRSLARVFAPGIRVNCVAPGFVPTQWTQSGLGERFEEVLKANERKAVLQQACRPEDIAAAILSLITGSDMVTGQTLVCDGGMLVASRL
ncbi:MAG: SDR family NAD(P)-dependent oxidoreductase [Acidobacteriota bacterium]